MEKHISSKEGNLCVFCQKSAETKDHVPSKLIFPKPRPDNLVTVPACFNCNNSSGKDEEYFLATFMFSDAGTSEAGKKLWNQKLNRMYDKNIGLRGKIAQNIESAKEIYTPTGIYLGKRMILNLDEERVYKVIRKIVRGLYYLEYQEVMPVSQDLDCLFIQTQEHFDAAKESAGELRSGSKVWDGIFRYSHNRIEEGRLGSIWLLEFYNFATFWVVDYNSEDFNPQ